MRNNERNDAVTRREFFSSWGQLFGAKAREDRRFKSNHLPGFLQNADAIRAKGIDTIAFMAVNDIHVMNAWGKDQGVGDEIVMLADGNGDYAEALDLVLDGTAFGMGKRGKRFAIVVDDGVATQVAVEDPGQFEVSKAESILSAI